MISALVTQFLVFVLVLAFTAFVFRRKRPKNFPPGPLSLPFIGNAYQFGLEPYKTFMKMGEKYGNVIAIDFGSLRGVVLNDWTTIKNAFERDTFTGRPRLRPFVERSGGSPRGLIFTDGQTWVDQRRFFLKTLRDFGFGKKSFEGLIHDEIRELAETFQKDVGTSIVMKTQFNAPVLNSLWSIMTGERLPTDDPDFKKIVYYLTEALAEQGAAGAFFFFPTLSKWFPGLTGYTQYMLIMMPAYDIIKKAMDSHKKTFQNDDSRDVMDVYLREILKTKDPHSSFFGENGELNLSFGLEDLFLAGAETTSTTLRWIFFIMAQKPELQQKLFDEISQVVGLSRLPSLTDRESMPYTEAVILETLRFSAMVPLGVFHTTTEDVEFQGYNIPKGTLIVPNIYGASRDPKAWDNPDDFQPERFILPDGKVNRYSEKFVPFSVGKRMCLGHSLARDELFLFTTTLFQKFQVTLDRSKPVPPVNECVPGLALSPKPHSLILLER